MPKLLRQLLPFVSLLLIIIGLSVHDLFFVHGHAQFLTEDNFLNVLRRSSVNAIIAVGMTAIIISGGIDLSVGSMMALAGMAGAWAMIKAGGDPLSPQEMWLRTLARIVVGT